MSGLFCKDCIHAKKPGELYLDWTCRKAPRTSNVTGKEYFNFCSTERTCGKCGEIGLNFEPTTEFSAEEEHYRKCLELITQNIYVDE